MFEDVAECLPVLITFAQQHVAAARPPRLNWSEHVFGNKSLFFINFNSKCAWRMCQPAGALENGQTHFQINSLPLKWAVGLVLKAFELFA